MIYSILAILLWVTSGVIAMGLTIADFQEQFGHMSENEYFGHLAFGILMAIMGPIGLVVATICSSCGRHGWYITKREFNKRRKIEQVIAKLDRQDMKIIPWNV